MNRLFKRIPAIYPLVVITALAGSGYWVEAQILKRVAHQRAVNTEFQKQLDHTSPLAEHFSVMRTLKLDDVDKFKTGFSQVAISRKSLFEAGLSAQEERRLLDKQLEIMTTYLLIHPALQRVFLMRAEQPLQSYLISYIPLRAFAGAPQNIPNTVRIISKERFASPERGKSEEVNGKLQYTPPQVGTSVRSNALGEFVVFTNSKLILHGPPVNPEMHEKFPHICLGLDLDAARRIYRGSFIGTRVVLNTTAIAVPISASPEVATSSAAIPAEPQP